MKPLKIVAILVVIYAGIVAAFESMIGYRQPKHESAIVITTFDADGTAHDRVVSRLDTDGRMYVAANHWPRAWYRRALANPQVQASIDGEKKSFRAVSVEDDAEHDRVDGEHPRGGMFRFLTGYPPRAFIRLDPV
jgi:hypothetical protein